MTREEAELTIRMCSKQVERLELARSESISDRAREIYDEHLAKHLTRFNQGGHR
jgi:hypothetical protein